MMGIFRDIVNFFKKEIELNKEYYAGLEEEPGEPQQEERMEEMIRAAP